MAMHQILAGNISSKENVFQSYVHLMTLFLQVLVSLEVSVHALLSTPLCNKLQLSSLHRYL
jgi:hypothetical protein